jgi:acetylornithine aminotransferase
MNQHKYAYISSLGGNEISCLVARKVLEVASDPAFLAHVRTVMSNLKAGIDAVCADYQMLSPGTEFGGFVTVHAPDQETGRRLSRALFENGVLVHSVSEIAPYAVKLLPPLVLDNEGVEAITSALRRAASTI